MPLSTAKPGLKAAIEAAFKKQKDDALAAGEAADIDPDALIKTLAEELTKAIHDYVTSAQVNPGIQVNTDPSTGIGATSAPGSLS
tara:strand:- start:196 stop:450 length:255 start_codon:yes stop_codon:yes gene_type:complete